MRVLRQTGLIVGIPIQCALGALCVLIMGVYVCSQIVFDSWSDLVLWLKR